MVAEPRTRSTSTLTTDLTAVGLVRAVEWPRLGAAVLCAAILLASCGSSEEVDEAATTRVAPETTAESEALTEAEGKDADRKFATTDLQLEVDATSDSVAVVLSGVVRNAGPSDAGNVRVSVEGGVGLAPPDPFLAPNCEVVGDVIDCLVSASLAVTGSAPHRPEDEVAEFEVILPVDQGLLSTDREVTVTVVVTADDLDLDNDLDPLSNASVVAVVIPTG